MIRLETVTDEVHIEVLGRFRVVTGETQVAEADWPARRAWELVALLALADGHRMPRDQVVEQLWPHLGAQAGAANLRKAAHLARRTLDDPEALALRGGHVELFPGRRVAVDAEAFAHDAERALRDGDPAACAAAAAAAGGTGELLPGAPYESWAQEPRRRARGLLVELLRRSGQWERLLDVDPSDEAACRAQMRAAIAAGERHVAIRAYERLRLALIRELGLQPSIETRTLYDECTTGVRLDEPAFVGRETELAAAMAQAQAVSAGRAAAAVLVRGSAGIGKSALCREVAGRLSDRGWRIVTVRATAPAAPYAAVGSVVEELLADGREQLDAAPARTRSILAALTPLAQPAPPLEAALTRHQVVAALQRVLAPTGPSPPTLLWVDDAHLLDQATAGALHQLVAASGDQPLMVLLACRSEWIRTSLPAGILALARADRTRSLELEPLGGEQVAALVALASAVPPPPELVARVVETAQGSPFFALELARAMGSPTASAPQTVRQAVAARIAGLDAATVDALTALAVGEDEPDLASVLALTGLDEEGAFPLLDAGLDAGVLVIAGGRYRFRHELVRQGLTDELPAHRRVQLHRAAASRLIAAGAAPERIADHWLKGERPAEAVSWLLEAARRAIAVGAYADALAEIERALVQAPSHHDGLCLRAEVLDALGDSRASAAYAAAADAIGEPESHELRARQALAELKASNPDSALRTLQGITPRSTAGRLAEALTLSAAAAIGRYADADAAAAKAQEAHALALELGDPGAILDATWAHALAAHAKGELPARLRGYLRATHELPELATRVFDGQLCVTERMLYGGLPNAEIIAFADGLAAEAQRIGAARGHAFALTLRGEAGILAGHLDQADRDFADGARLHGQIGAVAGEALSLLGRAQVAILRGCPEHARPLLADALLMARESEVGHHTLDRVHGAIIEAADEPADALLRVRDAEAAIQGPAETCPTCRIAFIVPATIASARAGDLERAQRYERDCARALEIVALPPAWHAAVEEARGWLAGAEGRRDGAREHFAHAADGFSTWGQPLDAARCRELAMR